MTKIWGIRKDGSLEELQGKAKISFIGLKLIEAAKKLKEMGLKDVVILETLLMATDLLGEMLDAPESKATSPAGVEANTKPMNQDALLYCPLHKHAHRPGSPVCDRFLDASLKNEGGPKQ